MKNTTPSKIVISMTHIDNAEMFAKRLRKFCDIASTGGHAELYIKHNGFIMLCGYVAHDLSVKSVEHVVEDVSAIDLSDLRESLIRSAMASINCTDFLNQKPTCPKCESTDIRQRWHIGRYITGGTHCCSRSDIHGEIDEHLHMYCDTCNYDWIGKVFSEQSSEVSERTTATVQELGVIDDIDLCRSCYENQLGCDGTKNITFKTGVGHDNVIECSGYRPIAQEYSAEVAKRVADPPTKTDEQVIEECEELAIMLAKMCGWEFFDSAAKENFHNCENPHAQHYWKLAVAAYEHITSSCVQTALANLEEEEP